MGLRFRKSFKIAPGVRMNVGLGGTSWTIGPRGASIGIGKSGAYFNAGIPGTGLSSRTRLSSGSSTQSASRPPTEKIHMSLTVQVGDDGEITFTDEQGMPANAYLIAEAKKQQGDVILNLIKTKCDKINQQVEALGQIHYFTPSPSENPSYTQIPYEEPAPVKEADRKPNLFQKWLKRSRLKIEAENAQHDAAYQAALQVWKAQKNLHDAAEAARKAFIDRVCHGDVAGVESFLEAALNEIEWPRETELSFDFFDLGKRIAIDVNLPEIEDMPRKTASVPQRGMRLSVKEMSATAVQ